MHIPKHFIPKMNLSYLNKSALHTLLTFLLLTLLNFVKCERIYNQIYTNLTSDHYCVRRLNSTSHVGCTSKLGGNTGILWYVKSQDDLNHVLETGPTPPYIVALEVEFFTKDVILNFKRHQDRISGVVFIVQEGLGKLAPPFSPDDTCPNRHSGLYAHDEEYSNCKKNDWQSTHVSGLLYEQIPFPIFMINKEVSIRQLDNCFSVNVQGGYNHDARTEKKVQASYPLCGIHLDSFMLASTNSKRCFNSLYSLSEQLMQTTTPRCNIMFPNNIFGYYRAAVGLPLFNYSTSILRPSFVGNKSVTLITTKLSSISMFSNISPGLDSTISGVVTLLAVAHALKKVRPPIQEFGDRNIAFALFDAEPFDYTGSDRVAYDMNAGTFPSIGFHKEGNKTEEILQNIKLSSIKTIVDLGQLANHKSGSDLYLHFEPKLTEQTQKQEIFETFHGAGTSNNINFKIASSDQSNQKLPLPPSSLQTFLKYLSKNNNDIQYSGTTISNYETKFSNQFYHSIFDNINMHNLNSSTTEILVDHLTKVSSSIAQAVYKLTFLDSNHDQLNHEIKADGKIVEQLLNCYTINANCSLFTEAYMFGHKLPDEPIQTYHDPTKKSGDMNVVITKNLLAYFLYDNTPDIEKYNLSTCLNEDRKSKSYNFMFVNGKKNSTEGICIRSQVFSETRDSLGFTQAEDGTVAVDKKYAAWTVSYTNIKNPVRIFQVPSPVYEWTVFGIGIIILLLSFLLVHMVNVAMSKLSDNSV